MHGLLLVDKPIGLTSAAVVAKIKRHFGFKKVGHGGTLDPFASGLLVLLVGDATKVARFLLEGHKTYEAEADLRFETDTGDNTGQPLPHDDSGQISQQTIEETLPRFCGTILQRPPMYSAIKRDGKPLYSYAREGKVLDIPEREIHIQSLELVDFTKQKIRFRVTSSGGTYIRVLAQDWARAAGGRAHLSMLRRTHSHNFFLSNALNLDSLLSSTAPPALIPLTQALAHVPSISCDKSMAQMLRNGRLDAVERLIPEWPEHAGFVIAVEKDEAKRIIAILSKQNEASTPAIERVFDHGSREA